jgi:hypothetical protein
MFHPLSRTGHWTRVVSHRIGDAFNDLSIILTKIGYRIPPVRRPVYRLSLMSHKAGASARLWWADYVRKTISREARRNRENQEH